MKKVLALILVLILSGCRIVSNKIVIKGNDNTTTPTSEQHQAADKELGDIAPTVKGIPGL